MKAIIAPDAARTPGAAVICVYDAPGAGPADVAIYSGDGKYLSASGWQESRVPLPVDAHDDGQRLPAPAGRCGRGGQSRQAGTLSVHGR